ncbi:MAG: hypothetical protein AAFR73_03440 [Pseudomonadota bacterium]
MAVKDTLDKIVERHPDVIGAIVMHDGKVWHNLESPYDIVDTKMTLETFGEIFEQTAVLEDEGYDFCELMVDFVNHSFIVRSIDNGLLAVLSPQMQRGQLVKLHVGLGIFGKAVEKALAEETAEPEAPAPAAETAPVAGPDAHLAQDDAHKEENAPRDESFIGAALGFGRKRPGGFRGTRELLASRVAAAETEAEDAVNEPTPKEEPEGAESDVPLRPDGSPMKMRKYRGQTFWE